MKKMYARLNTLIPFIFIILNLTSCVKMLTGRLDNEQDVYKLTDVNSDEYTGYRNVVSPELSTHSLASALVSENKFNLKAVDLVKFAKQSDDKNLLEKYKGQNWVYLIQLQHNTAYWKFLNSAYLKGFGKLDIGTPDRQVYGVNVLTEYVPIYISEKVLKDNIETGLDIKVSGSQGETFVMIRPYHIKGFLQKVKEVS
jgi:hypothetical protein